VGLPDELHRTALRIVADELDHARLSHDCLTALGGADEPIPLELNALELPSPEGPLAALVDNIVRNFCLGETFAVPLFDAMRRTATHPAVQPALTRILQDEAVHRAFGWSALDALLQIDETGVRERVMQHLPAWLEGFRKAYAGMPNSNTLTDEELTMGLIPLSTYAEVHDRTVAEDIRVRFAARGIDIQEVV
jgi:1,2-phenylacetyl-CoA epoxidase catalytic subunit